MTNNILSFILQKQWNRIRSDHQRNHCRRFTTLQDTDTDSLSSIDPYRLLDDDLRDVYTDIRQVSNLPVFPYILLSNIILENITKISLISVTNNKQTYKFLCVWFVKHSDLIIQSRSSVETEKTS